MKYFLLEALSPLYEAVQASNLFADSKYFVDCTPLAPLETILNAYQTAKNNPDFELAAFIDRYFEPPHTQQINYETGDKDIITHLHALWDVLTRHPEDAPQSTLICLPYPYIVPGGRFREIYYWDTYFSMLGLKVCKRIDLIENMTKNFAYLIQNIGFIPNGNRSYYLGRSQPPFFSHIVELLAEATGDNILLNYQTYLHKEYLFFMQEADTLKNGEASRHVVCLPDGIILNRYWDEQTTPRPEAYAEDVAIAAHATATPPSVTYRNIRVACASGWDFSSRWFADGQNMATIETTHLLPIDLNCLLLHLEETLMNSYERQGDIRLHPLFEEKVNKRRAAIQKYHWNETEGFFFDYNFVKKSFTKHRTLAALFPLFVGVATQEQAEKVAVIIENNFLYKGGLITTLQQSGQQWDAPNGWSPLQWVAVAGLSRYGFDDLARKIAHHWLRNCEKVFAATGKMMEKYNVMNTQHAAGGGEYPNQDGFGWTNGVYLALKEKYDKKQ